MCEIPRLDKCEGTSDDHEMNVLILHYKSSIGSVKVCADRATLSSKSIHYATRAATRLRKHQYWRHSTHEWSLERVAMPSVMSGALTLSGAQPWLKSWGGPRFGSRARPKARLGAGCRRGSPLPLWGSGGINSPPKIFENVC